MADKLVLKISYELSQKRGLEQHLFAYLSYKTLHVSSLNASRQNKVHFSSGSTIYWHISLCNIPKDHLIA